MLSLRERIVSKGLAWSIGSIVYSHSPTAPSGTLPLNGAYYDPKDPKYLKLFRRIGYRFGKNAEGHFRVPLLSTFLSIHNPAGTGSYGRNQTVFLERRATIRQHSHGSGSTSRSGDHSHSFSITNVSIGGTPGTNGTGSPNCTSAPSSPSLGSSGNHSHSASANQAGMSNWRPACVISRGYIIYGGE